MKVYKFGGTSIGSAERMKDVANLITDGERKIVVLSAMSGTTNALIEITESLHKNSKGPAIEKIGGLEKKYKKVVQELFIEESYKNLGKEFIQSHFDHIRSFTIDVFTANDEKAILAQGELIATALFQLYLQEQKVDSVLLPAINFMRIDANGEPDNYYIKENLKRELGKYSDKDLIITQGYICRNLYGEIDNLKRGGSDYTASLIGAAVKADEIHIWTDINGFHNNDPRFVENTKPIPKLSFDEAAELAYFGAKILHPLSINPAKVSNIPVRLRNTMKPEDEGTLISSIAEGEGIKAVASKDGITALKIKSGRMLLAYGFLRKVFEVFERYKTPIDMITTSEVAVSVTIDDTTFLKEITDELAQYGVVELNKNQSIICIVGENIIDQKGYINKIFEALKSFKIRMISYGGSRHNISILVKTEDKKEALNAINKIL